METMHPIHNKNRMPNSKDILTWKQNSIITITAGTGTGKSHFIKHELYSHCKQNDKKILMLLHRVNCKQQFQTEIEQNNKTDIITLQTYQSIEMIGDSYNFNEYDYIVCDEFHYFMSDASFNKTTDISLNNILYAQNKIIILMSATGYYMKNYINNIKKIKTINYELPINYNFIDTLTFFDNDSYMETLAQQFIDNGNKAIFFIQSAEKAYKFYKRYKDYSIFNCSDTNKYSKYIDKEKRDTMLRQEKFDCLLLITTTALDAGINIKDTSLTHIVTDVSDIGSLLQCIGRKRVRWHNIGSNRYVEETVHIIIKNINNKVLGGRITQANERIEKANFLRNKNNTVKDYVEKFGRDTDISNIVYDEIVTTENKKDKHKTTKKVNELMYFKTLIDRETARKMIKLGKEGYIKFMADLLGKGEHYMKIEDAEQKQSIEEVLSKFVGKKLYKEEKDILINVIDFRVDGKIQKSYTKLNYALSDILKLPYVIKAEKGKSFRDKDGIVRNEKGYWIIGETIFDDNN